MNAKWKEASDKGLAAIKKRRMKRKHLSDFQVENRRDSQVPADENDIGAVSIKRAIEREAMLHREAKRELATLRARFADFIYEQHRA